MVVITLRKRGRPVSRNFLELQEAVLSGSDECLFLYGRVMTISVAGLSRTPRWVATMLAHGRPGPGQVPVQTCGVIGCVNGNHWRWGTMKESAANRRMKRRDGGSNPNAKLTREQVIEIRTTVGLTGAKRRDLASRYGVSIHTINAVLRGQTWPGVGVDEF